MSDDKYMIYQLKAGDELHSHRFEPLDRLRAAGLAVERGNYERIYTGALDDHGQWPTEKMLAALYFQFNVNHPADFTGHSLSISDVVVLRQDDRVTAHYVDSGFDFAEVPEFLEGPYLYHLTQRPVAPGTFPKTEGGPVRIENYDRRGPVEDGSFEAWGWLEYSVPLTKVQADAYELRPSPQNPNCFITPPCQQEARLYVVAGWEHAGHIAEKQRITAKQPDGSYALGDPAQYWLVKMRFDRIVSGRVKQPSIADQLAEGAKRSAEQDRAARPAPDKKADMER